MIYNSLHYIYIFRVFSPLILNGGVTKMGKVTFFDLNGPAYLAAKCYFFLEISSCSTCLSDRSFLKSNVYIYITINANKLNISTVFYVNIAIKHSCSLLLDNPLQLLHFFIYSLLLSILSILICLINKTNHGSNQSLSWTV